MPKRINVPSYSRADSEFFHEELVPYHHVVYKVFVMRACFIRHGPASVEEF